MTDSYSFNLIDEPWIPCLWLDGTPVDLSLHEVLAQAHGLQMVAAESPQVTAALMRLLLAILHRVFGPTDEDAWAELWAAQRFDAGALDAYFQEWSHRFDLFDAERPFYQMDDPRVQPKSSVSLKYGIGFLHNRHFDHADEDSGFEMSPAEAARAVVTVHAFGLGGVAGIPDDKHTDGPCASGVLFFVHGDTLKETLLLNLPEYPQENFFRPASDADAPAWEQENPFDEERQEPYGLLDYLTWQSRRPQIYPQQDASGRITVTQYKLAPGLRIGKEVTDPFKVYRVSKESGLLPLRFSEDKGLWRESAALFSFDEEDDNATRAPRTFAWLSRLVRDLEESVGLPKSKTYRCLAMGLAKDRGKMLFTRSETLPLLPEYLADANLVEMLTSALSDTEKVARDLLRAVRVAGMYIHIAQAEAVKWPIYGIQLKASRTIRKEEEKEIENWVTHSGVERGYWASLDVPFQALVVRLPSDREAARIDWQQTLEDAAFAAFDKISLYAGDDGRSLKALVRGRQALAFSLRRDLPLIHEQLNQQPTTEEETL